MRILFFLLFPIFLSAQINRAYGVIELGSTFPSSSATGPKFAYRPADSSFYRWQHTNVWVKVVEPSITPDTLYLQQISGTTAIVNGDTINLTPYVLKTDTSSMLAAYIKLVGYGIIKTGQTIRADTTSPNGLATRLFAKTLPTSILNGQVAYSNGSNLVGSANHFWDNSNARLGIGTNLPSYAIDVQRNSASSVLINAANINNGAGADARIQVQPSSNSAIIAQFGKTTTGFAGYKSLIANDAFIYNTATNGNIHFYNDFTSGKILMTTGGGSTIQWSLLQNGNNLIGTTTDIPTSILTARSTTKSSSPFPLHTLAESDAITGVQGNFDYETTQNGLRWYNGTRKAYALESTFARGTATRVPFFDANGQVTQDAGVQFNSTTDALSVTSNGSGEATLSFASLGTGNQGTITYNGTQAYTPGLNIISNKFIKLTPSAVNNYVATTGTGPNGYTGNYVGFSFSALAAFNLVIGGPSASSRFTSSAFSQLNATDGNFSTTAFASTLLIRGGNALTTAGGIGSGGDVIIRGGNRMNTSSAFGHVIFQNDGTNSFGNVGVKELNPVEDFEVNGDSRFKDSVRIDVLPNQTTATKILSVDASGWVGYRAFSDFATTWLKPELEAGRDVDITGGISTDFRLRSNTRTQFDGKLKVGSDSSFVHDPAQDTTFIRGNIKQIGSQILQFGSNAGPNFPNIIYYASDGAYTVPGTSYRSPGVGRFNWFILNDQRGFGEDGFGIKNENLYSGYGPVSYTTLFTVRNNGNIELGYPEVSRYTRVNSDTFMVSQTYTSSPETVINTSPFYVVGFSTRQKVVAQSKFYIGTDSTLKFDPANDQLQLSQYGTGIKEATDLSKTQSNYIAGFATDGTVVEMEDLHVATTGLVTMDEYDNSASFTPNAVGEEATELFLTTSATTGKVLQRGMRQTTNVKDADLAVTDDMLELSFDIHVWAYCSISASDSVVIDLPTPALDYVSQKVSVYGDGRNATPGRDVYVRCVGAKLWHGFSAPTAETYYQVTSLGGINSKTAEFVCVQNPDDSLYYWQLIQHQ